jgi:hypothetical protein
MQTIELNEPTLSDANQKLRDAVEARLSGGCCDGGKCTPKATRAPHPSSRRFLDLLDEMRRLHESKSADYGSEEDPLANVRSGADFVNIEPWRGCMVRIADKVQRLRTYCRTGRLVHEGVRDTLLDLSAYSLLAIVLFDEGHDAG